MITTDGSDRFDLTVYVHEFTADSLQIDKREGIDNMSLLLSGKIDDPDVSPMGDIREFLPGSRFSEQSCEIRLMKQKPNFAWLQDKEMTLGKGVFGVIVTKPMLENEFWGDYAIPPVRASIYLRAETLSVIRAQLSKCHLDKKLLQFCMSFDVAEKQLRSEASPEDSFSSSNLGKLDISVKQRFEISAISTAVSIYKNESDLDLDEKEAEPQKQSRVVIDYSSHLDRIEEKLEQVTDEINTKYDHTVEKISLDLDVRLASIENRIQKIDEASRLPTDFLSRLILKIPIIGSFLKARLK